MRIRTAVSSALAAALVLFALTPAAAETLDATGPAQPPEGTVRYAGATRYETAVEASQLFEPGVPVVFVASGADFPDALSAAAAAAHLGGPLLLTRKDALPADVPAELDRLNPESIIVVGGAALVSDDVLDDLSAYSSSVERIAGANRYETSLALADSAFGDTGVAYVASGRTFPDALAASGAAGAFGGPVVLVDGRADAVPQAVKDTLEDHRVGFVFIAGETGSVSAGVASSLTGAGFFVTRRGGADRYATAVAVNGDLELEDVPAVFLASGADFPDALAGAAIAGGLGAPLYLAREACVPAAARAAIRAIEAPSLVVMGGESVVSEQAAGLAPCAD